MNTKFRSITKNIFALFILTILLFGCVKDDENTVNTTSYPGSRTLVHNGINREYFVYVPVTYDSTSQLPMIFNFHGGDGDIASAIQYSDMRTNADSVGFILVYPQALPDPNGKDPSKGGGVWTYKDASTTTEVDNLGFVAAMIDKLASEYNIDEERVYASGYSNGGEFAFELACRLSNRIAAIGVVARTMFTETHNNCSPIHPTGVLTILGTSDPVSDYNGVWFDGVQYYLSADEVHNYWVSHNNCDTIPVFSALPDINTSDGSKVERYTWSNGDGGVYVQHYKVIGGGHDWPGSFGNMDIDASLEICNFVTKYDINGLR